MLYKPFEVCTAPSGTDNQVSKRWKGNMNRWVLCVCGVCVDVQVNYMWSCCCECMCGVRAVFGPVEQWTEEACPANSFY